MKKTIKLLFGFLLIHRSLMAMDLFDAIKTEKFDSARALVGEHPDMVNSKDRDGRTALLLSASLGKLEMAQFLVEQRADVNAKTLAGVTALMEASSGGFLPIVLLLLRNGAHVDSRKGPGGETALFVAMSNGALSCVDALVRIGHADLRTHDYLEHSLWEVARGKCKHSENHFAALPNKVELVRYLNRILYDPVDKGDVALVQQLLGQGASANPLQEEFITHASTSSLPEEAQTGETVLMQAAAAGDIAMTKTLLAYGANVDARRKDNGETALHTAAAQKERIEIAQELLAHSANVDIPDNHGYTPLMLASIDNIVEMVMALLPRTQAIDAKNKKGQTALMLAANEVIAQLLIDEGHANVNLADSVGKTNLEYAAQLGNAKLVALLLQHKARAGMVKAFQFAYARQAAAEFRETAKELSLCMAVESLRGKKSA